VSSGAQSAQLSIQARDGCNWNVQNDPPWATPAAASGSGDAVLTLTIAANTATQPRTATMTVGGRAVQLIQAGAPVVVPPPSGVTEPCATLRLQRTGDQIAAGATSGATLFAVYADDACQWQAESNASWVTVVSGGRGFGNGTVGYLVNRNPDILSRSTSITIANAAGDQAFTVNQVAQDPASAQTNGDGGGDGGDGGGGSGSSGGSSG
jgi:uncharacterized membrane protein YgcG